ncbi:MAG: CDP-2,3-bis-(O-geranylgeranyl)-sn-glycerol synthase [Aigarchaeota archaeon]|nr:CDP-2,3-bis-(O-geranylgeranyl)-sn-glycerol synthase [Aigarchaeota archaeon]MCX8192548.1 CDP-2,3-bis-(O-geranylgeranyl)-sn-glycerol synthase [Nitrososphaeria archaeon]MDW7985716.1 CDP-2,3-bis-(O-geranylgeranyl)-sn-glycerol synthase [Nitrososphaerota archaeon]
MEELIDYMLEAILYVFPAYVANATPVVTVRLLGKSTPLDMGLRAWDGRRILGDGKTVEGLLSGVVAGSSIGLLIYYFVNLFRSVSEPFILALGAMVGDIFGSFIKRRIGLERGRSLPLLDQLGFLLFSLIFSSLIYGLPRWMKLDVFLILLIITFILHISTNYVAYILGLKNRPY